GILVTRPRRDKARRELAGDRSALSSALATAAPRARAARRFAGADVVASAAPLTRLLQCAGGEQAGDGLLRRRGRRAERLDDAAEGLAVVGPHVGDDRVGKALACRGARGARATGTAAASGGSAAACATSAAEDRAEGFERAPADELVELRDERFDVAL